jgi:hypothetical protein
MQSTQASLSLLAVQAVLGFSLGGGGGIEAMAKQACVHRADQTRSPRVNMSAGEGLSPQRSQNWQFNGDAGSCSSAHALMHHDLMPSITPDELAWKPSSFISVALLHVHVLLSQ